MEHASVDTPLSHTEGTKQDLQQVVESIAWSNFRQSLLEPGGRDSAPSAVGINPS